MAADNECMCVKELSDTVMDGASVILTGSFFRLLGFKDCAKCCLNCVTSC